MDGSNRRTTRLQLRRAAAEAPCEAAAAVGNTGALPRHSLVAPPVQALEARMTRSQAASLASTSTATSHNSKRAAEEQQLPPGKKQAAWKHLAEAMAQAPAQHLQHLPEVIAGTISEPLDTPTQLTGITALLKALQEHSAAVVDKLLAQQQQAPASQKIVRHLLRVAQGTEGLAAQVAQSVICDAVSQACRRSVGAAQIILAGLFADQQSGAKHLLQSAVAPAKTVFTGDRMTAAAMFAVADLAAVAWRRRSAEPNEAAAALFLQWYDFVVTTQQALPDLLQALQNKNTSMGSCITLAAFANGLPQHMFRDICTLPAHQGLKRLIAPLHGGEAVDHIEGLVATVIRSGVQQPVQHQRAMLEALLSVQESPALAIFLNFAAVEYSNGLLLPHLKYVLQQLLVSSDRQCQQHLATAVSYCVVHIAQDGIPHLIQDGLRLLIQVMSDCTPEAAHPIAVALHHVISEQPEEMLVALSAHTEALIAAAQPGRSLVGAHLAVTWLAMIGGHAATTHQRQPLLKHVNELLMIMNLHNHQYAWPGEALDPDALPSPATAAAEALGVLLRCQRGIAALLREQSISGLFAAVSQCPLGAGATAAADLIFTLARRHAGWRVLFVNPWHVFVLDDLQQPLLSLTQPGAVQQPEGLNALKVLCSMTQAAELCGVVPGYLGDLAKIMWQVPAMTQQVASTLFAMAGVGLCEVAPHARHIAYATRLHAPAMEDMLQWWLSCVEWEVMLLRNDVCVLDSKTERLAVHLAQIHQQFRRWPRSRKLQLTVVVLLQRLSLMVEMLECDKQQLQEIQTADKVPQEEIEQQVRQAAEQQQI